MTRPLNVQILDNPFGDNPGDPGSPVGGGGDPGSPVSDANNVIDDLQVAEGATKPLAYGRHLVAGQLILHNYSLGPPASSTVLVALGVGEWDSVEKLWYSGEEIDASAYHFHPGTQSTGPSDPVQGVDSFFPAGLTYSETAYIAVQIPEPFVSEDRPDKLRGLYRTLKVSDYDSNGNEIGYGYSANPARVVADLIIKRAKRPKSRIHWAYWTRFRDYCNELVPWDDGNSVRMLPRFECHIVFSQATNLADALASALGTAGAFWQDDGQQIRFLPPLDLPTVHEFNMSNIVDGSFAFYQKDIRERSNRLQAKFRNLDDDFLIETQIETKRESLQEKVGIVDPGIRSFGNMRIGQAQRLLERQMRLEADYAIYCELRGQGDSFHVLPGDYVLVTHDVPLWTGVRCLVIDAVDESAEDTADERSFLMQRIDAAVYSDGDQKPIQEPIVPGSEPQNPLMSGLIHYWKLDEIGGADRADSVGSLPFTPQGTMKSTASAGRVGNAFDTNNGTGVLRCDSIDLSGTSWTIAGWLLAYAGSGQYPLVTQGDGSNGTLDIYINYNPGISGGAWSVQCGPTGGLTASIVTPINTSGSVWTFVVVSYDKPSQILGISLNAGPFTTVVGAYTHNSGTTPMLMGELIYSGAGYILQGKIDELGIWNRVLSPAQVTELFNSGNGNTTPFS